MHIGIDKIDMPLYLQKPQIVMRYNGNQLLFDEEHRWAEQANRNIARVVETNLNRLISNATIESSPWPSGFTPKYRLVLNIIEFDVDAKGVSRLRARYQLTDSTGKKTLLKKTFSIKKQIKNSSKNVLVQSMSQNLSHLCRDIAKNIKTLRT